MPYKDPEKQADWQRKRYIEKRDHCLAVHRAWLASNPNYDAEYAKRWRTNNPGKKSAYQCMKNATDAKYRLARVLRCRLWNALKGGAKTGSAVTLLGCSVADAVAYIERQFRPGMEWSNHGEWHIDHIIPLAKFDLTDAAQVAVVCHHTNLQPLWAAENQSKGAN